MLLEGVYSYFTDKYDMGVFDVTSFYSSIRTAEASQMRVSCLKFEPVVSNLPVISARMADITHTTIGSLFSFNG